jgi:hypothetical protein
MLIEEYFQRLCSSKLESLEELAKFLNTHDLLKIEPIGYKQTKQTKEI